jgi:hypothetical protein
MAYRPPNPEIAAAKAAAEALGAQGAIIVYVKGNQLGAASFGWTRQSCTEMGKLCDAAYKAVMAELSKQE